MNGSFFLFNGDARGKGDLLFGPSNRAFRFGDFFFETMRASGDHIFLAELHNDRLRRALDVFRMELQFDLDKEYQKLRELNGFSNSRLRLTVFREGEGMYLPETDKASWILECDELNDSRYTTKPEGIRLNVFPEPLKARNSFSMFKTAGPGFVAASAWCRGQDCDECLILNDAGRIAEALKSNVFLAEKSLLITPPLSEGCVDGTMRKYVMQIASEAGINVSEQPITREDAAGAEELFLTNAMTGIQSVNSLEGKTYEMQLAERLTTLLKRKLQERISGSE